MRTRRIIRFCLLLYILGSLILGISLGELAFRPNRRLITQEQTIGISADFGVSLQNVSITASDHVTLRGWYARPVSSNGNAVILLHGHGDNRQGMTGYAELFLSRGFSVLLPDSRAHGESGGRFPTFGINESEDVHRWFDWLTKQDHPKCIFGMGESMGAAILLQAIRKESRFCAVIAESPFASFREVGYLRVGQFVHAGPWLGEVPLRPAVELAFLYGRVTRHVDLTKASPEFAVAESRVPVLLIHGLADTNIPVQESETIHAANSAYTTLWEIPGAGHCGGISTVPKEFTARVVGWFESHEYASAAK